MTTTAADLHPVLCRLWKEQVMTFSADFIDAPHIEVVSHDPLKVSYFEPVVETGQVQGSEPPIFFLAGQAGGVWRCSIAVSEGGIMDMRTLIFINIRSE